MTPTPAPFPPAGGPVRPRPARPARVIRGVVLLGLVVLSAGLAASVGVRVWFDHHLRAARREVDRGHNATAGRHLRAAATVRPDHPELLLLAARVARRSGGWDEADELLDHYSARYGDDDRLAFERLLGRATRGELDRAGPALAARVAAGGPDARAAREAVAAGLLDRYRWAEADRVLADWLAADPDDTAALLVRGKLEDQQHQSTQARATFRRAVELDPDHDEARLRLAAALLQVHQGAEALPHLDRLRRRLPDNTEVLVEWSRAAALAGRTADARAALDACLRVRPDDPAALAERGQHAAADGDDRAAEADLGRAVRLDPGSLPTRHRYAAVLERVGKGAEAARERGAAAGLEADAEQIDQLVRGPLQVRPNDPAVYHEVGVISLRAGRPGEAVRWLRAALAVAPDHAPTHAALAGYYHRAGSPAPAAKHRALSQPSTGKGPSPP